MYAREPLLLVSKLSVPPWRSHWINRPRLWQRAARVVEARLLLCAAPAGFGKTTALIAWAEQRRVAGATVAWYTLDAADNDLTRFAAYLLGALAQADPELPLTTLQQQAGADVDSLLGGLLNLLAATHRAYLLVLDDYHLIHAPAVHQAVALLLERLPASVQLAIGTRADPPLPLARLRVRGLLAELRTADLQFDPIEIAAFLEQCVGLALTSSALARLEAWTEGWAAGLQLVALALPATPVDAAVIDQLHTHFAGSQRHIFTFLADEVFAQQSPEVQAFLLATSVLDHLSPELCDALVKSEVRSEKLEAGSSLPTSDFSLPASTFMLEQLEQANLFLVRLDSSRPWYRYHHLFRNFLRRRLDQTWPGRRAQLHQRASQWFLAAGEIIQAVNHALEAGDIALAADLIVRVAWMQLSARGEIATILGWVERFPPGQLVSQPLLCLFFGRSAYLTMQFAMAERFFTLAEQGLSRATLNDATLATSRALLLFFRAATILHDGALSRATLWLAEAEPVLAHDDPGYASTAGICHYLRGDLTAAYAAFTQMEELARRANHAYLEVDAVQHLALVDITAGRLTDAERRSAAQLTGFADELPPIPALGLLLARLGSVAYHRGQLEKAEDLLRQGAQVVRRSLGYADRQIWYLLMRVMVAQGDRDKIRALLAEDGGQSDMRDGAVLASIVIAARIDGLLALGAVDEAWHWSQRCDQLRGEHLREIEALPIARVLLARRQPQEALSRLEQFIAATEQGGRVERLIEGLVIQARALYELRCLPEAQASLQQAIELAAREGFARVFLNEGPTVAALLGRMKDEGRRMNPDIAQLLTLVTGNEALVLTPDLHPSSFIPLPLAEPLTEREHEVLRLIAAGATNQDIATTLVVTVGTVKTHLNHILGKLEARNRTEAVARARALGIL